MSPLIEQFSDKYYILDSDTEPYGGDTVAVAHDMYLDLMDHVEIPMLKVDSQHYVIDNQWAIPPNTIALPNTLSDTEPAPVLMPNSEAVTEIVKRDQWVEEVNQ